MSIKSKKSSVELLSSSSILVVGDLMLDRFVWGEVSRISPEAPVPVVEVHEETSLLGGAANVANNIISLGGKCILAGLVGDDKAGETLLALAEGSGVDVSCIFKDRCQTTVKTRLLARNQQVARVDREDFRRENEIPQDFISGVLEAVKSAGAVIVSDYNKGVINSRLMHDLVKAAFEMDIMLLVDPKPSNRSVYHNASLVTPNCNEAEALSRINIHDIPSAASAAAEIAKQLSIDNVLITMGKDGMVLWRNNQEMLAIPTTAMDVFDVTGAGDTVISIMGMGAASGLDLEQSARIANIAAGLVVGKVGTATVNMQELSEAVETHYKI